MNKPESLKDIVEVFESKSITLTNQCLRSGWVLIETLKYNDDGQCVKYILGKTEAITVDEKCFLSSCLHDLDGAEKFLHMKKFLGQHANYLFCAILAKQTNEELKSLVDFVPDAQNIEYYAGNIAGIHKSGTDIKL
jgi:hypothetical protein